MTLKSDRLTNVTEDVLRFLSGSMVSKVLLKPIFVAEDEGTPPRGYC
jgi:hypothetical protein